MTDLTPNIPEVVAEVRVLFKRYEQALIDKNVEVMDGTYWNSPYTIRFGPAEHGYGFDQIQAAFRYVIVQAGRLLLITLVLPATQLALLLIVLVFRLWRLRESRIKKPRLAWRTTRELIETPMNADSSLDLQGSGPHEPAR